MKRTLKKLNSSEKEIEFLLRLDFFERNGTNNGLGIYSEQASESVHYDWEASVWVQGYKVAESHPSYPSNLMRATAKYNSRHLV